MRIEDLRFLLRLGHETPSVEFKSPGPAKSPHLRAVVARACMAMANQRDGGTVIVGVSEATDHRFEPVGIAADDQTGWAFDPVAGFINSCCEPPIEFELGQLQDPEDGRTYAVLEIEEFAEYPVVCTKTISLDAGKPPLLRSGAIYIRSRKTPASIEIAGQAEMRALIELTIEKQVPRIAKLLGVFAGRPEPGPTQDGADAEFDAQRKKLLE
jgi:predicted HTH transcriptional regulator